MNAASGRRKLVRNWGILLLEMIAATYGVQAKVFASDWVSVPFASAVRRLDDLTVIDTGGTRRHLAIQTNTSINGPEFTDTTSLVCSDDFGNQATLVVDSYTLTPRTPGAPGSILGLNITAASLAAGPSNTLIASFIEVEYTGALPAAHFTLRSYLYTNGKWTPTSSVSLTENLKDASGYLLSCVVDSAGNPGWLYVSYTYDGLGKQITALVYIDYLFSQTVIATADFFKTAYSCSLAYGPDGTLFAVVEGQGAAAYEKPANIPMQEIYFIDPPNDSTEQRLFGSRVGTDATELTGVCADGVAPVDLYYPVPPGTAVDQVVFTIDESSGSTGLGDFGNLIAQPGYGGAYISHAALEIVNWKGKPYASVRYYPPLDYVRHGVGQSDDLNSKERDIAFRVFLNGTQQPATKTLKLARPPVMLLHGLWSDRHTWDRLVMYLAAREKFIMRGDYHETHASSFMINRDQAPIWIRRALQSAWGPRYAARQADVVGHSMGGLLTRYYVEGLSLARISDRKDIHKFITLGSPHSGSQMASILGLPTVTAVLSDVLALQDKSITFGAVRDLSVDSDATNNYLNGPYYLSHAYPVPTYAIVGESSVQGAIAGSEEGFLYQVLSFYFPGTLDANVVQTILGSPNDLIVGGVSQRGGLTSPHTFGIVVPGGHLAETSNPDVANWIMALLNSPLSDNQFSPISFSNPAHLTFVSPFKDLPRALASKGAGTVSIDTPTDGAVVAPGASVNVQVTATGAVNKVFLTLGQDSVVVDSPPFRHTFAVPVEFLGNLPVIAIGRDDGGILNSKHVTITVATSETPVSLVMDPDGVLPLDVGTTYTLGVMATYADTNARNVTAAANGTTYVSSAPDVASVDTNGKVTALTNGQTTITASNASLTAQVTVSVSTAPAAPPNPILFLSKTELPVGSAAGTANVAVSNIGSGTYAWSAGVTGGTWLRITSGASGNDSGTIGLVYDRNLSLQPRTATLNVDAGSATGSPGVVTVSQAGAATLTSDINRDSAINAVDVQLVINAALGISSNFDVDVDGNNSVDAIDVQLVINAALGL